MRPNGSNPHVVETQGKNPPSALRGFGPGGRIPRDTAHEVISPRGAYGQNDKDRTTVEEVEDETPRRGGRNDDEEESVSFAVKRPVFF